MPTPYEQQLATILNGLRIDPVGRWITLLADGSETIYQPGTLHSTLTNLIYKHFYCAGEAPTSGEARPVSDSFVEELSRHNHTSERFDAPWTVGTVDAAGTVYATKGNARRMLHAGEFVYDQLKRGPVQPGDTLRLLLYREHRDAQSGFYYVFGQTPGDDSVTLQTRLYFHVSPDGSAPLVAWVTRTLNAYHVPFQFKCLNHPDLYGRPDPAVLYVQKPHITLVLDRLIEALAELRPFLLPTVPPFTRPVAPGIAFAESPPNPVESFGTSRCGLIAQGITKAVENGQPASTWADAVQAVFGQIGLSLEHPYRSSHYPYAFPDCSPD